MVKPANPQSQGQTPCCPEIYSKPVSASPCSKTSDLEEELKNVTNNLKSLEAQAEKVSVSCVSVSSVILRLSLWLLS